MRRSMHLAFVHCTDITDAPMRRCITDHNYAQKETLTLVHFATSFEYRYDS